ARCHAIAAASIVAKVHRDACMRVWDEVFPGYGLASHKGYSTPEHYRALEQLGPTPLHRLIFEPVLAHCRFPIDYNPQLDLFVAGGAAGCRPGLSHLGSENRFQVRSPSSRLPIAVSQDVGGPPDYVLSRDRILSGHFSVDGILGKQLLLLADS